MASASRARAGITGVKRPGDGLSNENAKRADTGDTESDSTQVSVGNLLNIDFWHLPKLCHRHARQVGDLGNPFEDVERWARTAIPRGDWDDNTHVGHWMRSAALGAVYMFRNGYCYDNGREFVTVPVFGQWSEYDGFKCFASDEGIEWFSILRTRKLEFDTGDPRYPSLDVGSWTMSRHGKPVIVGKDNRFYQSVLDAFRERNPASIGADNEIEVARKHLTMISDLEEEPPRPQEADMRDYGPHLRIIGKRRDVAVSQLTTTHELIDAQMEALQALERGGVSKDEPSKEMFNQGSQPAKKQETNISPNTMPPPNPTTPEKSGTVGTTITHGLPTPDSKEAKENSFTRASKPHAGLPTPGSKVTGESKEDMNKGLYKKFREGFESPTGKKEKEKTPATGASRPHAGFPMPGSKVIGESKEDMNKGLYEKFREGFESPTGKKEKTPATRASRPNVGLPTPERDQKSTSTPTGQPTGKKPSPATEARDAFRGFPATDKGQSSFTSPSTTGTEVKPVATGPPNTNAVQNKGKGKEAVAENSRVNTEAKEATQGVKPQDDVKARLAAAEAKAKANALANRAKFEAISRAQAAAQDAAKKKPDPQGSGKGKEPQTSLGTGVKGPDAAKELQTGELHGQSQALSFGIELELIVAVILEEERDGTDIDEELLPALNVVPLTPGKEKNDRERRKYNSEEYTRGWVEGQFRATMMGLGVPIVDKDGGLLNEDSKNERISAQRAYWGWDIGYDSSVKLPESVANAYGGRTRWISVELKSPAYWARPENLSEVRRVVGHLSSSLRFLTPTTSGFHVHVGRGRSAFSLAELKRLAGMCYATGSLLSQLHPASRHESAYCQNNRLYSNLAHWMTVEQSIAYRRSHQSSSSSNNKIPAGLPLQKLGPATRESAQRPADTPRFQRMINRGDIPSEVFSLQRYQDWADPELGGALPNPNGPPRGIEPAINELWRAPSVSDLVNLFQEVNSRDYAYNFARYAVYGEEDGNDESLTVEFRQAASTLDADSVVAWVRILVNLACVALHSRPDEFARLAHCCAKAEWAPRWYDVFDLLVDLDMPRTAQFIQTRMLSQPYQNPWAEPATTTTTTTTGAPPPKA